MLAIGGAPHVFVSEGPAPAPPPSAISEVQTSYFAADAAFVADPAYTTLQSIIQSGTAFLVFANVSGLVNGGPITPRLRVLVDTVETAGMGSYGSETVNAGAGVQMTVQGYVTGLAAGAHTFTLEGAWGGVGGWTTHPATNPLREYAVLTVMTLS